MQNYIDLAEKNGVVLIDVGKCQFCGADTKRGIHECIEIFNLGFQGIDFIKSEDHIYRFLIVDAHTLQHPEIHGRWSNHFHLSRLHLIFKYDITWTYKLSPQLSDYLNLYKTGKQDEYLVPPEVGKRGNITSTDILEKEDNEKACKNLIRNWAIEVYQRWNDNHSIVDNIVTGYLNRKEKANY